MRPFQLPRRLLCTIPTAAAAPLHRAKVGQRELREACMKRQQRLRAANKGHLPGLLDIRALAGARRTLLLLGTVHGTATSREAVRKTI